MPPKRFGAPPDHGRLGDFEREAYFVNFQRLRIGIGVVLAASLLLVYLVDVRNAIDLAPELRSFSLTAHLFSCGLAGLALLVAARIAPASPAQVGGRHRTFVRAASVAGFTIAGLTFVLSLLHQGVTTTYVFAIMFYALLLSDPGRFDLAIYAGNALFFQASLLWLRPQAPFDVDGLVATVGAYVISRQTLRWRRREFQARRTIEEQARGIEVANRKLARAKSAAEDASRAKGEFLARMSHEVRTPMNGVLGVSGLLLETELSERQRRYATAIRSSGEALVRVLDDVLDLAKLEAGRLTLAPASFDVRQVAGDALALFGETCRARGVELRLEVAPDVPAWVRGDSGRVRQVLLNLVANAARLTRAGEIAVVVGTSASQGEVLLSFEVRDTGPGIPEPEAATLFEPFVQAGGGAGGTGLGLAICRELVELMGGRIGCESASGRGSRFWFTVRAAQGEPPAAGESPAREAAGSAGRYRGRALLAEDDPVSRMVVTELLERRGLAVDVAEDGRRAVDAALASAYDLILMDAQMTGLDGYAATREIRHLELGRRTPIVAVTADVLDGARERARAAGMDDVLTKPIRERELERVLSDRLAVSPGSVAAPGILLELRAAMGPRFPVVVRRYLEEAPAAIATLRDAASRGDAEQMRREAHRLKGASAFLGASELAVLCDRLTRPESLATSEAALGCVAELERAWSRTRDSLEAAGA